MVLDAATREVCDNECDKAFLATGTSLIAMLTVSLSR